MLLQQYHLLQQTITATLYSNESPTYKPKYLQYLYIQQSIQKYNNNKTQEPTIMRKNLQRLETTEHNNNNNNINRQSTTISRSQNYVPIMARKQQQSYNRSYQTSQLKQQRQTVNNNKSYGNKSNSLTSTITTLYKNNNTHQQPTSILQQQQRRLLYEQKHNNTNNNSSSPQSQHIFSSSTKHNNYLTIIKDDDKVIQQSSTKKHNNYYSNSNKLIYQHNNNNNSIERIKDYNYSNHSKSNNNNQPYQPLLLSSKTTTNNIPAIKQQFTTINKTISSLRKQPKLYNDQNYQLKQHLSNYTSYATNPTNNHVLKKSPQHNQNTQLYQMMKTILLGQQKLQKQLQLIKNNKFMSNQNSQPKSIHNYNHQEFNRMPLREKKFKNPKINQYSYHQPNNVNSLAVSPLKNNYQKLLKSPLQHKNINDKENLKSQQNSSVKQRRCNSAAQSKNKTGKITKNNKQQQFMELYKQAQKQRHLNPNNPRIAISQQTITSVWNRIKSVIERSSAEDIESSKINHENNRYVNDHLVNSIELQRRLKNDLIKKVYDMCENKCLFK